MVSSNIITKSNYTLNIPYIISTYIREYDISKANINILLYKNYINLDMYNLLCSMEKMDREVYIGKQIKRNPEIQTIISDGILEMRALFIQQNNISDEDILSIKNDAIYIINKIPTITKFKNVEFVMKNYYTSYIKLNKYEIYYLCDNMNNIEGIDVKGINDSTLSLHENYMISFICQILYELESGNVKDAFNYFNKFFDDYINLRLDLGYYREFNPESKFMSKPISGHRYIFDSFDKKDINILDINYNANILRDLYRILLNISKGRKL